MQTYLIYRNKYKEAANMGRQTNGPKMKEQDDFPEKALTEMKASNLSDIEFRVMITRVLHIMI